MRRKLTPNFVDSVDLRSGREMWISDTTVPGFGMRVWASDSPGKSFAVRATDGNGKPFRRTICPATGQNLEHAREVAQEIIFISKGKIHRLSAVQRLKVDLPEFTLNEWTEKVLAVQARSGASLNYIEQLQEVYSTHADQSIGKKTLCELSSNEIWDCIASAAHMPGSARKLQSFLHLVLSFAGRFDRHCERLAQKLSERSNYQYSPFARPSLGLKQEDFRPLFQTLHQESECRQIALFILLVFLLGVRPKELMRARWSQIEEGFFVPERKADWRRLLDRTKISGVLLPIFDELHSIRQVIDPTSPFIFPSAKSNKSGHLATYYGYWHRVRKYHNLPDVPLFYLARHFNNPVYFKLKEAGFAPSTIRVIARSDI